MSCISDRTTLKNDEPNIFRRKSVKRIKVIVIALGLILSLLVVSISPILAAKPDGSDGTRDVIAMSNGFPSGEHYNLNVHGKIGY
jgi:hypothetical protein